MRIVLGRISEVEADILVNAANGIGIMGAGVAADLAAAYPWVRSAFRAACLSRWPKLGDVVLTFPPDGRGPAIWHAVTVRFPGIPTSVGVVSRCLAGLRDAFLEYVTERKEQRVRIAVPALGTGHGRIRPDHRYFSLFLDFTDSVEYAGGEVILVGPAFRSIHPDSLSKIAGEASKEVMEEFDRMLRYEHRR